MKATQVVEMQADLVARMEGAPFQTYVKRCIHDAFQDEPLADKACMHMLGHVRRGDAFLVTEDMSMLVKFASSQLDESDTFDRMILPSDCGLVRFDEPLPFKELRGRTMLANWMQWGPVASMKTDAYGHETPLHGVVVVWWNDNRTHPDDVAMQIQDRMRERSTTQADDIVGRWGYIGMELIYDGEIIGSELDKVPPEYIASMMERRDDEWLAPALDTDGNASTTNGKRYAQALWLLLSQTITTVSEGRVRPTVARKVEKKHITPRVSVVQLRRISLLSNGESNVEWTCRWIVKGHWAWRRCSRHHLTAVEYDKGWRVRLWINGYVKGPENAPLRGSTKVYKLSR